MEPSDFEFFDPDPFLDASRDLWHYFHSGEFRNDYWLCEKAARLVLWIYHKLVVADAAAAPLTLTVRGGIVVGGRVTLTVKKADPAPAP